MADDVYKSDLKNILCKIHDFNSRLKAFEPVLKQIIDKIHDSNRHTNSVAMLLNLLYGVVYANFPELKNPLINILNAPPKPGPDCDATYSFDLIKKIQRTFQVINNPSAPSVSSEPAWLKGIIEGGLNEPGSN
ncbi:MAG: hypothetical protein HF978_14220 [Desulfobacteraceae bacterium]|nr:hypothetical protein [Desulfobacteraceae bacterium]MBC2756694.1 hypothetical protein [Desulfobacteraceae bacterium]